MKKLIYFVSAVILFQPGELMAQDSTAASKHRVAIFAPLYLDSAFDVTNTYRYGGDFPEFINSGLEFYEGAEMALDSLGEEGNADKLEVFVYDTRSNTKTLQSQLEEAVSNNVELIIAHIAGKELFQFARVAKENHIPVINANMPNDGGITDNPYFVILNSTLRTHCEEIYKYLQKYNATDKIVVFRKKGQMEDVIQSYFTNYAKVTASTQLNLQFVNLADNFTINQLTSYLDSNRKSICIAASLDTAFTNNIIAKLSTVAKSYEPEIIGMPTWDNISFTRPEQKGVEIVYTTPFYNARTDKVSMSVVNNFNKEMYAKPSDMVVRGFETTWKFSKLLLKYGPDLSSNLGNKEFNIIRSFDIQPVLNKTQFTLDYFENRKLYFVKWLDGLIKSAN